MAFATTRWSVVLAAGREAPSALGDLFRIYASPLYAFARRRGAGPEDAHDLVQGFFLALLEKPFLRRADPERGRFRTFLLTAFRRHASKVREKGRARKRGGGRAFLPLDLETEEASYRAEPRDEETAERLFERRWALALLRAVMGDLAAEHGRRGRSPPFSDLEPFLLPTSPSPPQAEAAARAGVTPEAFRVALHRLRRRYRARLLARIRDTVADPGDVEDEIRHLMAAVAGATRRRGVG